jgi:hypothetical protein
MSGNPRYLLDTNTLVSLLAGNRLLAQKLESSSFVGISIISYLEFLAFDGLSERDRNCFFQFCERVEVVPLNLDEQPLLMETLTLRSTHRLKLPDAIIGAAALHRNAVLITNDSHFHTIPHLITQSC